MPSITMNQFALSWRKSITDFRLSEGSWLFHLRVGQKASSSTLSLVTDALVRYLLSLYHARTPKVRLEGVLDEQEITAAQKLLQRKVLTSPKGNFTTIFLVIEIAPLLLRRVI